MNVEFSINSIQCNFDQRYSSIFIESNLYIERLMNAIFEDEYMGTNIVWMYERLCHIYRRFNLIGDIGWMGNKHWLLAVSVDYVIYVWVFDMQWKL